MPRLTQSGASAICVLGLFDERAFRRMQPLIQQLDDVPVLIGVKRNGQTVPADEGASSLVPNLKLFCELVATVGD